MRRLEAILLVTLAVALTACNSSPSGISEGEQIAGAPANAVTQPSSAKLPAAIDREGPQGSSSLDCSSAEEVAEHLLCSVGNIARMDQEMVRLYRLALTGPHASSAANQELITEQRDFARSRDACRKDGDPHQCTKVAYARRIHRLRQSHFDARQQDDNGISLGPFAYSCEGLDALIGVTFINSDPGAVYMEWRNQELVLDQAPSGSGARYTGQWSNGAWTFWIHGTAATFSRPGLKDISCKVEPIG